MNSHDSCFEKTTHEHRVQMQRIMITNKAWCGEICSEDVNTRKGHYNFKADSDQDVSLSFSMRAKKGDKERTGLALRHQSLAFAYMRKTKLPRRRHTLKVVKKIT